MPAVLGVAALVAALPGCRDERPAAEVAADALPAYVDEAGCVRCHAAEAERWTGSHHDLAMQPATDATVLGDFDDATFEHRGTVTRFFRDEGAFRVTTTGPSGAPEDFDVPYVFGVEPLQQLLLALPGGRLQALSVAWDTAAGRWFHLYPDEDVAVDDPLHWTGRYQTWNTMCAECHSTNLDKAYDPQTRTYATTFDVVDVGCQACHGPGARHVAWAEGGGSVADAPPGHGLVVDFGVMDPACQVDQCARCHARRHRVAPRHVAGRAFLDEYSPELLREGLYHADGQILDEVYVYGSFVQSKMYAKGVRCSDCHDPHSLELWVEGDATCLQCHSEQAPLERFPSLTAKRYDTPEHHHHAPESEGARCLACHMPARTYMVVDPRRDHSFRVPRPDLTAALGTPNACGGCHADEGAAWAAEAVASWRGGPPGPHWSAALALGRAGGPGALDALAGLALDEEAPAIARATALEQLSRYGNSGLPVLAAALHDDDPLVRATAAEGLEGAPAQALPELCGPLLEDDVRAVRTAAARALASVPPATLGEPGTARRDAFDAALAEYVAAQEADADMPAAHLNLAVLRDRQGRRGDAERAYRLALELDPFFLPARFNLANLLNGMRRNPEAEAVLRDGLARAVEDGPRRGELQYSLGLLLAEMERMEDAVQALEEAARLLPDRPRVRYNLALARLRTGDEPGGEADLLAAVRLAPDDPDLVHALASHHATRERWERALPWAQKLVELVPDAPGPRELQQRVQDELARKYERD